MLRFVGGLLLLTIVDHQTGFVYRKTKQVFVMMMIGS